MPSGKKSIEAIRWSAFVAGQEFGVTTSKVKAGLRRLGIVSSGKDGKFTTQEIAAALFKTDAKEQRAKESRWDSQIDEAKYKRNQREEQECRLVDVKMAQEAFDDLVATHVSIIRHSKMTDMEK